MTSDEDLAQAVKNGDIKAMHHLVHRHADRLTGYIYRMVDGHRDLTDDLLQESFLRMLRGIHSYQPSRPFKPWLYSIATNVVREHFRRADTRRTISGDDTFFATRTAPTTPEQDVTQGQRIDQIIKAIRHLPQSQREVIILFYYEDLAIAEIADTLGIPSGTVKSRLSIARGRLREQLKGEINVG